MGQNEHLRGHVIGVLLAALILTGCATSPVPYAAAAPVAESNLLDGYGQFSQPNEGRVRVIVVRDSGVGSPALPAKLSIDGVSVAKFWSSERLELYLPPTTYIFGVESSICFGCALVETAVDIKPGKTYAFRISFRDSAFYFQQSAQLQ